MINTKDNDEMLTNLCKAYFIEKMHYVSNIQTWVQENNKVLSEPHNPMKLVVTPDDKLAMIVQEEIADDMLSDVIKNLGVRWSVQDNATDIEKKFHSLKQRLAYSFLKEYARTLNKTDGEELNEDLWVTEEMEYLDFFNE